MSGDLVEVEAYCVGCMWFTGAIAHIVLLGIPLRREEPGEDITAWPGPQWALPTPRYPGSIANLLRVLWVG